MVTNKWMIFKFCIILSIVNATSELRNHNIKMHSMKHYIKVIYFINCHIWGLSQYILGLLAPAWAKTRYLMRQHNQVDYLLGQLLSWNQYCFCRQFTRFWNSISTQRNISQAAENRIYQCLKNVTTKGRRNRLGSTHQSDCLQQGVVNHIQKL